MAVTTFLQEEKKTAKIRAQQCEAFLAHKIEGSGVLEDPEVRQQLYNLTKETLTYDTRITLLLSLIRC